MARMVELATQYGRYGYRRVTAILHGEGWKVNPKRVERLWRQEGLKVPSRQPKRRRLWLNDGSTVKSALCANLTGFLPRTNAQRQTLTVAGKTYPRGPALPVPRSMRYSNPLTPSHLTFFTVACCVSPSCSQLSSESSMIFDSTDHVPFTVPRNKINAALAMLNTSLIICVSIKICPFVAI